MQTPDRQFLERLSIETRGREMREITSTVADVLRRQGARDGLLTVFIRHTSASLTIQENADPDVRVDLLDTLDRLAPADAPYIHTIEGPDDMPAHVKTALTDTSLSIPVEGGRMVLGTWQGLYVVEHRSRRHVRDVVLHYLGTARD
ncbi:secondary thiamine-phosphate synthase enzyme YjbQ [Aureimonas pseudogalii]|uniref:Secondary thiamine-phosphate synthase enzyme n=1 Tax=Aureimonas pseudogalii TaxID=1744844 RepID=A0A7W6H3F1_9HYPH|nr:secondary thiamine-phosphate synthase enzyme YjbQ [Aureimonas pseudogalii]MBB3997996.1 secondary thiamine-phosphate synthase enzyme [Aureimonas pseudogalii]